jgi:predicted alpha/beta-hydrolase family hydrolase
MDSPFLAEIAAGLAGRGWRVVRFEFPYMARQRLTGRRGAPDRLPKLLEAFREQVALEGAETLRSGMAPAPLRPLLIGGKSLGGRVASLLVDELAEAGSVRGCLCLGYPFHPPGRPQQRRTEHLALLRTPTLILQGERDPFGRRGEVESYTLSSAVELRWIPVADHGFTPTRALGLSDADNRAAAVAHAHRFLEKLL